MIKFLSKLWKLNRPYRGRFLLGVFFGVVNGVFQPLVYVTAFFVVTVIFRSDATQNIDKKINLSVPGWLPHAAQNFIFYFKDVILAGFKSWVTIHAGGSMGWRIAVVSLIPLVVLVRGVVAYLNSYLMSWVAVRTACDLRARYFEHLLNLPLSFFARMSTGELMSRSGDIGIVQNMMAVTLVTLISAPNTILICLCGMFAVEWKLTLVAMFVFPVCIIPINIYSRKGRKASAAIQTEAAALGKRMHEAFTGNRIIKAYNLEEIVVAQFKATLKTFISHAMRVVRATETPGPLIEFMGAIGISAIILYLAGTTGEMGFVAFMGFFLMIYPPVKSLVRLQSTITQAEGATRRVFELLATPNNLTDPPHPVPVHAAGAEIHFDNVSFGYGDKTVLHNIQLKVKPGQMIAIVGRTGAGKTTLTNLLLRFYDPTAGALRIGGTDLRQFALRDLRSQIAVVTQEVILFNDTFRSNIACGRPGATAAEVEQAAKHAHAHDFIMDKPKGYETVIGEQGVMLSGGQRQRLSIARAILKNAPILVLDEAMSSLDNESERLVQAALDELMKGRTTFCIAHRLSTIRHADLILVLDQGRIVETGAHDELLARDGLYHKLHDLQFRKTLSKNAP